MEVTEQVGVMAPMRDGTRLACDVYRPADTWKYPVLLLRTPYNRRLDRYVGSARRIAQHGYVVVIQDLRGRFGSEGEFWWQFGRDEWTSDAEDGYDSVEWCATLPHSTGEVGTFGHSYHAWAQWKLVALQPPSLRAMFPGGMSPTPNDWTHGILETGRRLQWIYMMAAGQRQRSGVSDAPNTTDEANHIWENIEGSKWIWRLPLASIPPSVFGDLTDQFQRYLSHQHDDRNGEQWDFYPTHHAVDVPVCLLTGWWDRVVATAKHYPGIVSNGSPRVRDRHRLIIGPWTHAPWTFGSRLGDLDFGADADRDWEDLVVGWFDHELKGVSNAYDDAPVQIFLVGANRWIGLDSWPPRGSVLEDHYLSSAGDAVGQIGRGRLLLTAPELEPPDSYVYDPRDPVMSILTRDAQAAPLDQSALRSRPDVAWYDTPVQTEPITYIGDVTLDLWIQSDAPDTDFIAKLLLVEENGRAVNLSYGAVRIGLATPRATQGTNDDVVSLYRIDLRPIAIRLDSGQRLRLMVTSSDFPNFDRNHNTGEPYWSDPELREAQQKVFHDRLRPSVLRLPRHTSPLLPISR